MAKEKIASPDDERTPEQWAAFKAAEAKNLSDALEAVTGDAILNVQNAKLEPKNKEVV